MANDVAKAPAPAAEPKQSGPSVELAKSAAGAAADAQSMRAIAANAKDAKETTIGAGGVRVPENGRGVADQAHTDVKLANKLNAVEPAKTVGQLDAADAMKSVDGSRIAPSKDAIPGSAANGKQMEFSQGSKPETVFSSNVKAGAVPGANGKSELAGSGKGESAQGGTTKPEAAHVGSAKSASRDTFSQEFAQKERGMRFEMLSKKCAGCKRVHEQAGALCSTCAPYIAAVSKPQDPRTARKTQLQVVPGRAEEKPTETVVQLAIPGARRSS